MPGMPLKEELPADNRVPTKYEYTHSRNVMTSQTETTDVAKMLAYMDEVYKKKGAVPETITHNDTPNYNIQSQMGAEDVPTASLEKKEPNVRENPSSIDEPRAVNNHKQTNGVADKKEPRGSP